LLDDLDSRDKIVQQVSLLLRKADAVGRYPTPVEDLVAAANLTVTDEYVLDDSAIAKAPHYLRGLLRSARQKIQGLLDRRELVVHVSPTIDNEGKRRFVTLHETTHAILPHQQALIFGDDNSTLSPEAKYLFEREANQGAAELLFQLGDFKGQGADLEIGIAAIHRLAGLYGSSFHAAFRRYAETHRSALCGLVLDANSYPDGSYGRHAIVASMAWRNQFGDLRLPKRVTPLRFPALGALASWNLLDEVPMPDIAGTPRAIRIDSHCTRFNSFLLLWLPPRRRLLKPRAVRLAAAE
jgi:hypothetical protein